MVEEVLVKETSPVVTVTGRLIPNNKADVSFPNEVRIQEVYAKMGANVIEGEPLFKLADEDLNNELNLAKAKEGELEALVDKNRNLLSSREKLLEEGKIDQTEITRLEKEISVNDAELRRVKAEIAKLGYNLEHIVVNSPISGVVNKQNISSGSVAKPEEVLLTIVNVNPIIISFALDAKQSENVAIGTPLDIFVNELPDKPFGAKVSYISPELHNTDKTFEVWASIPNDDLLLKAGMTASTEFKGDALKQTYLIPAGAVLSEFSRPYVYKVSKGVAHKTLVTVSSVSGDQVEVMGGLEAGDIVVVKGGEALYDGADVNIWRR